jgi:hypothetical protein
MNQRMRIILFLVFGPIIALYIVYPVIFGNVQLEPDAILQALLVFFAIVIIKAAIIRTMHRFGIAKSYWISLLMSIFSLAALLPLIYLILFVRSISWTGIFIAPVLTVIIAIAYRIISGRNLMSSLAFAVVPCTIAWVLMDLHLYGLIADPYYKADVIWGGSIFLSLLSIFVFIMLMESWPASLYIPGEKVGKTVLWANLSVVVFSGIIVLILGLECASYYGARAYYAMIAVT